MEAAPGIAGGQGQINTVGKLSLLLKKKSVGVSVMEGTAVFLVLWKQENRLLLVIWES